MPGNSSAIVTDTLSPAAVCAALSVEPMFAKSVGAVVISFVPAIVLGIAGPAAHRRIRVRKDRVTL